MCGIFFYTTTEDNVSNYIDTLHKSSLTIKPRGPENTTIYYTNNNYICFHRLAIQNTSPECNQPFIYHNKNFSYYVLCNGEIYNYKDLIKLYSLSNIKNDCAIIYPLFEKFMNDNLDANQAFRKLNEIINGEFSMIICEISQNLNKITNIWCSTDQCSVRPLFEYYDENTIILSSLLKGITTCDHLNLKNKVRRVNSYEMIHYELKNNIYIRTSSLYRNELNLIENETQELYELIVNTFTNAVERRLHSDRPFGCLLSGGLDSSLVAAIASNILKKQGKQLRTFTIGMKGGTDLEYAKKVADHIGSIHTEINFIEQDGLDVLEDVIKCCETYDITTIRASVGQHLIAKWISKNTDIKVLLNGDLSDEEWCGYIYSHFAPDSNSLYEDSARLVRDVHYFDGLRVDRNISYWGLEARLPFTDKEFVELSQRISGEVRKPKFYKNKKMEKYILRKSFEEITPNLLPDEVLFRTKEAFSDALSKKDRSWFQIIQDWIETRTDIDLEKTYKYLPPISKESRWYREIFEREFSPNVVSVIPYFWMPKWIESNDPSARTLTIYDELN
jgi:asparagine synthase (glutamine-hydrolysing)